MVKFGQKLQNNAVISWWEQGKYVNYKQLKKLIKALWVAQQNPSRRRSLSENLLSRIPSFRWSPQSVSPVAEVSLIDTPTNAGASVMEGHAGAPTEGTPLLGAEPSPEFEERVREEIAKVESFYAEKCSEFGAQIELLREQVGSLRAQMPPSKSQEGSIQQALRTLYRDVRLLENYTILNYTALIKICKKHDKVLRRSASVRLHPDITRAQFARAERVHELEHDIEVVYASAFCGDERRVARSHLLLKMSNHQADNSDGRSKLFLGVRLGACLLLLIWVAWDAAVAGEERDAGPSPLYLTALPAFPIFRGCCGMILLLWLWGVSVLVWSRARINYMYLMAFRPKHTESVDAIFNDACNSTIVCLAVLLLYYKSLRNMAPDWIPPHLYPVILWFYVHVRLFFPWDARRRHFFSSLLAVMVSPFSEVSFYDSLVGDYLTSTVKINIDYAFSWCYFVSGEFLHARTEIGNTPHCWDRPAFTEIVTPLMVALPLWFRLMQNLRRFSDTGEHWPNLGNAFKYALCQVVVIFGAFHPLSLLLGFGIESDAAMQKADVIGRTARIAWLSSFIFAYLYAFIWDVALDWGLGSPTHGFLGSRLMYGKRWYYYAAMAFDLVGRFAWTLTLVPPKYLWTGWDLTTGLMIMELVRRTIWSFFRVENEHLLRTSMGFRRQHEFVPFHFESNVGIDTQSEKKSRLRNALEGVGITLVVVAFSACAIVAGKHAKA